MGLSEADTSKAVAAEAVQAVLGPTTTAIGALGTLRNSHSNSSSRDRRLFVALVGLIC